MNAHEYANLFPMITGSEFDLLVDDIKSNGLISPIVTYQGEILDGRNRFKACEELGIEPETEEYTGDDPIGYVVSLNIHRRHMNEAQRGMVAAKIANLAVGDNQHGGSTNSDSQSSLKDSADMLNVSRTSVAVAKKVQKEAEPEVVEKVEQGGMSLNVANDIIEFEPEEQIEVAALPKGEQRKAVEAIKEKKAPVRGTTGTGDNEWYTPRGHVESVRIVLKVIDLDPASSELANETVNATKFYSKDDDGLTKEWNGKVWMNPPYAQPFIEQFMRKLSDEYAAGNVSEAIALTHNYTDTKWFHYAQKFASAICFTRGRIGFESPEGKKAAPTQGQAFFYFGSDPKQFIEEFSQHGFVMEPASDE